MTKRDRDRGKRNGKAGRGDGKMQRGECGLLETASSGVVMRALAEHADAVLKEKTCLASSYCVSS